MRRSQPEDGLEDTKLHPSQHKFGVGRDIVGLKIASAIVPPIAKADVRSRGRDVAFKLKRAVSGKGVARETDRIAVASHSSPAMEDDRATVLPVQHHVIIEDMIEPKRLTKSWNISAG